MHCSSDLEFYIHSLYQKIQSLNFMDIVLKKAYKNNQVDAESCANTNSILCQSSYEYSLLYPNIES